MATNDSAEQGLAEQIVEAWRIHERIVRYVLAATADGALLAPAPGLKGRSVGEQFAHTHNVRLMWLQSASPELLGDLAKIDKADAGDKTLLTKSLEASGKAIALLVAAGLASGRVKGFKPNAAAFVGYLISHEAYHQGDIGVRLTTSGHPLDKKTSFGMWEWGVR